MGRGLKVFGLTPESVGVIGVHPCFKAFRQNCPITVFIVLTCCYRLGWKGCRQDLDIHEVEVLDVGGTFHSWSIAQKVTSIDENGYCARK